MNARKEEQHCDLLSPCCAPRRQVVQENYERLSDALTLLQARDGTVTVEELLSLLHTYSCSIQREQLVHHLLRSNTAIVLCSHSEMHSDVVISQTNCVSRYSIYPANHHVCVVPASPFLLSGLRFLWMINARG